MKKSEQGVGDLAHQQWTSICIKGVPEGKDARGGNDISWTNG